MSREMCEWCQATRSSTNWYLGVANRELAKALDETLELREINKQLHKTIKQLKAQLANQGEEKAA